MWLGQLSSWLSVEYEISIAICVLVVVWLVAGRVRRGNFPPGPFGLPVVGYFPFLGEEPFSDFINLGKKYGDVFSVQLGSERVVVLHGSEAIREAFCKPEFLGRTPHSTLELINKGSPFFANDMQLWREQRRFVVHALKDLGLGRTNIQEEVQDEIGHFLDVLSGHGGAPVDIKEPLSPSMSNNISALVFGKRLDYDDPDRLMLDSNLDEAVECLSQTDMYTYFSWARYIPFLVKLFQINKSIRAYEKLKFFFSQEIEQHRKTFDPKNVRDFIDSYILEMKARQEKDNNTTFSESTLLSNVTDLFEAGSETVRVSILWCVYIAAAFPDVQVRVRREILEVVGSERKPEFLDMRVMPYTHAVILEIMRWKTIVPLNVLRYTLEDTTVGGYDVPRHTIVIANFWNAHHDPRYWEEPETFNPARFLSKDGNSVVTSLHFMPFSIGKRACPGETMAYMEIFLYFASILQRFEIVFPEGIRPTFEAKASLNYRKKPYRVRFIPTPK